MMLLGLQSVVAVISIMFLRIALLIDSKSGVTLVYAISRSLTTLFYINMQIHFKYKKQGIDIAFAVGLGIYIMIETLMTG